jgi:hypothetical protein
VRLAEQLGEEGARAFAKAKGWTPVFDGVGRAIAQGPDQVYLGTDDLVHVIEAKGGSGQLGHAYGHPQGSSEWAVKSAKKVLCNSNATEAERRGAQAILESAAKGKLQVHVVRTSHILGEPTAAVLEQTVNCSDEAARLAQSALDDIARAAARGIDDAAMATDDVARAAARGIDDAAMATDDVARAAARGIDDAAMATDDVARAAARGIDDAAMATDDVARAAAESGTVAKTLANVALPAAVALDAGFRVLDGVKVEQRFATGQITSQQREVAHAKNTSGMFGGWAGAWAGAELGATGGAAAGTAVAPGPGTAIGGLAGGVAGGAAGYFAGEAAAAAAAEWAVDKVHAAGTSLSETASSAAGSVQRAWNWAWGN